MIFFIYCKPLIINFLHFDCAGVKYHDPTVFFFFYVLKIKDVNDCVLKILLVFVKIE